MCESEHFYCFCTLLYAFFFKNYAVSGGVNEGVNDAVNINMAYNGLCKI